MQIYSQEIAYFDPDTQPILSTINGKLRFVVSEEVLIRSVDIRVGKLGMVESFDKKMLDNKWFVLIECRFGADIEQSTMVALQLKKDTADNYFADHLWVACIGDSCGSCGWEGDGECFCKGDRPGEPGEPGHCYMVWSNDPLLRKVPLKKPD